GRVDPAFRAAPNTPSRYDHAHRTPPAAPVDVIRDLSDNRALFDAHLAGDLAPALPRRVGRDPDLRPPAAWLAGERRESAERLGFPRLRSRAAATQSRGAGHHAREHLPA